MKPENKTCNQDKKEKEKIKRNRKIRDDGIITELLKE